MSEPERRRDYEQLLLMSHDANHSKDVAKAELGRLALPHPEPAPAPRP